MVELPAERGQLFRVKVTAVGVSLWSLIDGGN